ncbi:esterase [Pseudooceanicola sp. CBS1P-1]|uniref:CMD domain protein n=1 Tax=Pseudooceanicola albus TaxID=2692189 RepID=A0A6L7G8Q8_9RHOB|nr:MULTISPECIES: hypothetical protein [Pseudooceanicola]MBT9384364.1 esterase [Pseudooceanicola endophyticus]MXN19898.1 hypothetical protein [Pseudooceanicola albus]
MTGSPDAIDSAIGLSPTDSLHALRALRPEFVSGSEDCRAAVLTPAADLGLSPALRMAVARRVAATAEMPRLLAGYPAPADPALAALAEGETPEDPALAALARHADMIARTPRAASAAHLAALQEAGYTVPQIIALSELLAYVCYQIRVVAGLSLLKGDAA